MPSSNLDGGGITPKSEHKEGGVNKVMLVSSEEGEEHKRQVQELTDFLYDDQKHVKFTNKKQSNNSTSQVMNINHKIDDLKQSDQGDC